MARIKYSWDTNISAFYNKIIKSIPIIDAHVHLGMDEDGNSTTAENLIKRMDEMKVSLSVIFPFSDPQAGKDFHKPNELILEAVKKYPKRFIPFFRLNPKKSWKREFKLRVKQGFVGIKLHPVRQKFKILNKNAMKIYELAEKNNLAVMLHSGLGMVSLFEEIKTIVQKYPKLKLILAHAAFVDMTNVIKVVKKYPNVYFDTSAIRVYDFYKLLNNIPADRIVFGSDYPFYNLPLSLELLLDTSMTFRKSSNSIKNMLGLNILNLLKETELFNKTKIKKKYNSKNKREHHDFYKDLFELTKFPFSQMKEIIEKIASYENRHRVLRVMFYLRLYTLLNSAEVLLRKDSYERSFNRLKIIKNITKKPFNKREEKYIDIINRTAKKILKNRRRLVYSLDDPTYNFAKTNIKICKNICILRMLKIESFLGR